MHDEASSMYVTMLDVLFTEVSAFYCVHIPDDGNNNRLIVDRFNACVAS
jgi:hypothetical protein